MLALHNYADRKRSFPAYANFDAEGKPLLSWRVHILPELGEGELYKQFHLDEPWDSEHNKTLISQMPAVFLDPSSGRSPVEGLTHYLGVKGENYFFNGTDKGVTFPEIRDGSSNTIAIVQVNDDRAPTWTKPDDWEPDDANLMKGLVPSLHPLAFLVVYADGHGKSVDQNIDRTVFKALLTRAGGERINMP